MSLHRANLEKALSRISGYVHRTPVMSSGFVDKLLGCSVLFKCENLQKVGAFKARGAINAVLSLPASVHTVITHSSGNHGAALAWAASQVNKKSLIIVPVDAKPIKKSAIRNYGGFIIDCGPAITDREKKLSEVLRETDAHFVPPYDDPDIICGQGTAALELQEDYPEIEELWVPIGGGGLAAGSALLDIQGNGPTVVCAEPSLARDAYDSLRTGEIQPALPPKTIADGLRTSLGRLNFEVLRSLNIHIELVHEEAILSAMSLIWSRMKLVVEPSAAVPLAGLLAKGTDAPAVGVILSGGNVEATFNLTN